MTAAAARARKLAGPALAGAALATSFARRRARAARKFTRAGEMYFTREGYEQSSSEAVARHRAARFAGYPRVADLCCGIGSDSVAIARAMQAGGHVDGIDRNADTLACARLNARAYGLESAITFHLGDALAWPLRHDAAFADPSRRTAGGRTARADQYEPPLQAIMERAGELKDRALGVKVAPGLRVDADRLAAMCAAPVELEYVSERGECKEAVIWCGALARGHGARRATVIDAAGTHVLDAQPFRAVAGDMQRFVGEPDPAVIRAGLIGALCAETRATLLDPDVAYMTAGSAPRRPFVRWFEVIESMPFNAKRLRAALRARDIGELVIKTRAFPLRPDEIAVLVKPAGAERAVLLCTTIRGKKTAIVCRAGPDALQSAGA
ncbi:MAG TPA: methyltransferase domain-containing protein [Candidatus Eremiobacteraceae bacterium]|nr:methyltransferase domain-containing protein [Candidatus Eremiobacteraceae bacterium]